MANISFYGSHNAAYVVEENGKILTVLEVERFLNYKNSGLAQYMCPKVEDIYFLSKYIPYFLMKKFNIEEFENCFYLNSDVIYFEKSYLERYVKAKKYTPGLHHKSHAAGSFYQSPYNEALIFSFDGGGNDGKFNIYTCKRGESPVLLEQVLNPLSNSPHIYYDLGFPYMLFGQYLSEIKLEDLSTGNLTYPGKLMGLSSYGNIIEEWIDPMTEFYKSDPNGINYYDKIKTLGKRIGVDFDPTKRLNGQTSYDIAKTSQKVFEECFLEIVKPYFEKYPNMPICMAGGCGLNILLNTRLVNEFNKDVFVPPDPNDCGIALGLMLDYLKPELPYDSTYSGLELLDLDMLGTYIQSVTNSVRFRSYFHKTERIVNDLNSGKIVGVCRGKSEHGPRALGNRSIICNPTIPEMKSILNDKVKHREWFRPFAPVVRLEDVNKYFEWEKESKWMGFCPTVRKKWRKKLAAVTHVDNTARVQTVTKDQNPWLYNLLTEFEKVSGVGVLLNTSFNVAGKPILSTIKDALEIFEKTDMDCLMIEDYYLKKIESVERHELKYVEDTGFDPDSSLIQLENCVIERSISPPIPQKKTKLVTSYYAYHHNSPYWGHEHRVERYKYSLISICNMGVDVVCYTDPGDMGYNDLCELKDKFKLDNLEIKTFDISDSPYKEQIYDITVKNTEYYNSVHRSPLIYSLKFLFLEMEYEKDINLYWIDCGLSFPGLFPEFASKFYYEDGLERFISNYPGEDMVTNEYKIYYYDKAFNEKTIKRINQFNDNKLILLNRGYSDDNPYLMMEKINGSIKYEIDTSEYPSGGFFGGNSNLIPGFIEKFKEVFELSLKNGHCGVDQEYMWYILWNNRDWFKIWGYTGFYHHGVMWKDIVDSDYISYSEFFLDEEYNIKK